MWRSFRNGWGIFMESRMGRLSLFTIIAFALMAAAHPLLMAFVWDPATYDPCDRLLLRPGGAAGPAELEASPRDRSAGPGRAEPACSTAPALSLCWG